MINMKLIKAESEIYNYTVVSRCRDVRGFPINDAHMRWESCQGEKMAMAYAEARVKEGYWVEVYKNVAYSVGVESEVEEKAKEAYHASVANDPIIHCNRFSTWEELIEKYREEWRERVSN